jgi:Spy/CpxP family protein refolding chaperone
VTVNKSLALAVYLGAVLVGAVVGVVADRVLLRDRLVPRPWDQRGMRDRLAAELALTAPQRAAMDTIFDERRAALDSVLKPLRPTVDSIYGAARTRFAGLLTPEQRADYERMQRGRDEGARRPE